MQYKQKPAPERLEQTWLFRWAAVTECKYPELRLMYHCPNGGKRDAKTAADLKKEGVKPGVPDICLPVPRGIYHGLYIELKIRGNKPTEYQVFYLDALSKQGYKTEVCYGWETASILIEDYLKLKVGTEI